jgi:hypothetical protein
MRHKIRRIMVCLATAVFHPQHSHNGLDQLPILDEPLAA